MKNSLIIFTFSLVLLNSVSPCETSNDFKNGAKFIKPSSSFDDIVLPINFGQINNARESLVICSGNAMSENKLQINFFK